LLVLIAYVYHNAVFRKRRNFSKTFHFSTPLNCDSAINAVLVQLGSLSDTCHSFYLQVAELQSYLLKESLHPIHEEGRPAGT